MGCSASRLDTLIAKAIEDPSSSSSSSSLFSNSSSSLYSSSKSMAEVSSSIIPKTRSLSAPLVHHPAVKKGDTHHLVCLTSSTYGSLVVAGSDNQGCFVEDSDFSGHSSPDSVINTWELMEGLEDEGSEFKGNKFDSGNDLKLKSLTSCDYIDAQKIPISRLGSNLDDSGSNFKVKSSNLGDFNDTQKLDSLKLGSNLSNFDVKHATLSDFEDACKKPISRLGLNMDDSLMKLSDSYVFVEVPGEIVEEEVEALNSITKPLWKHLSEESLLSKMDPNVDNTYHRALSAKKLGFSQSGKVSRSVGSSPFVSKSKNTECPAPLVSKLTGDDDSGKVSGCEDKIVLYFTSLRGIRKTYEDCCSVRMILRGFRVMVDERDISMDSSFRKELQSALCGKAMSLPQLFVRGRHIGGAEDVKLLHETGELERLLYGFPTMDSGFVCGTCGDARFVPCSNCSGSRKVFEKEEGRTRRCPDCNENGLIRCPGCCP